MSVFRKKWVLVGLALTLAGGSASAYFARKAAAAVTVTAEPIRPRDLEALVLASGKIDPKKTVNISAQSMGRVTRLAVREGDRVKAGQFLLQIDAVNAEAALRRDEAAVAGARKNMEQTQVQFPLFRARLDVARQALKRQQELWTAGLTTRASLEQAEADVKVREGELSAWEQQVQRDAEQLRQQEAGLTSSRHSLSQARFESPFDGIVTRRNIEEGENVMVGTMNNAGTVLLTVADMSVIEAEVEVDETDIPFVHLGQSAKVTIDAIPDKSFSGVVTEIGNSPIQTTGTGTIRTATNFKVTVTLDGQIPDVRPGFTCTASITTATRGRALSVPIQALTVRELLFDELGVVIPETRPPKPRFQWRATAATAAAPVSTEIKPGQKREEVEGVFLIRNGRAAFVRVTLGIAGERYLEVLSGLNDGDRVVTGPFESVRGLYEGDAVMTAEEVKATSGWLARLGIGG